MIWGKRYRLIPLGSRRPLEAALSRCLDVTGLAGFETNSLTLFGRGVQTEVFGKEPPALLDQMLIAFLGLAEGFEMRWLNAR